MLQQSSCHGRLQVSLTPHISKVPVPQQGIAVLTLCQLQHTVSPWPAKQTHSGQTKSQQHKAGVVPTWAKGTGANRSWAHCQPPGPESQSAAGAAWVSVVAPVNSNLACQPSYLCCPAVKRCPLLPGALPAAWACPCPNFCARVISAGGGPAMRPGTEPPYAPGAESVLPTEPVLKPCTCRIKVKSPG